MDKFLLEAQKKEGYLFPDTYFFFSSDDEKDVFNYMRNNFDKKMIKKKIIAAFAKTLQNCKDIINSFPILSTLFVLFTRFSLGRE